MDGKGRWGIVLVVIGLLLGSLGFLFCRIECLNGGCENGLRLSLICFLGAIFLGLILIALGVRIVQKNYQKHF